MTTPKNVSDGTDFELFTDGSGYHDNRFGGHALLIISQKHNLYEQRVVGYDGISVDRAEFGGFLHGLRTIMEVMEWTSGAQIKKLKVIKPTVTWHCDRQSLVGSVEKPAERHAQGDLWAQYAWYEELFDVTALFIPRKTNANHDIVDTLASEVRMVMKNYINDLGL